VPNYRGHAGKFMLKLIAAWTAMGNPGTPIEELDCFVARAPRNDGAKVSAHLSPSLRAQRSNPEAAKEELDCFRLRSTSFGGRGRRKRSSQ
jgi:hypothetical protein